MVWGRPNHLAIFQFIFIQKAIAPLVPLFNELSINQALRINTVHMAEQFLFHDSLDRQHPIFNGDDRCAPGEAIFRKFHHLVEQIPGDRLRNPIGRRPLHELGLVFFHFINFLFPHRPPQQIRFPEGIARQILGRIAK